MLGVCTHSELFLRVYIALVAVVLGIASANISVCSCFANLVAFHTLTNRWAYFREQYPIEGVADKFSKFKRHRALYLMVGTGSD